MFISADLHIPEKSPFDERLLKSVGVSIAFPCTASLLVDSSMGIASLYSDFIKTLLS